MPRYRRGNGSIYRRGRFWWIAFYIDGRQVSESARTADRKEARSLLQRRIVEAAEGRLVAHAHRATFEALATNFLADMRVNGRKTVADAARRIEKHLRPVFGGQKMDGVKTSEIRAYIQGRLDQGAKPSGICRELACLKRMYRLAVRDELLARVPPIPMPKEGPPRAGFFERDEFDRLLPHLPDWLRGPVSFAYHTGWRMKSEIFPLRWDQVDLVEGVVRLDPGTTKSGAGRMLYLSDELRALLESHRLDHDQLFPECPFVFHRFGKPIRQPLESWRKACKAAGLEGKLMHDFRRTAARDFLRAGIPQSTAMEMLGHKTAEVFRRYSITDQQVLREAAEKLNRAAAARLSRSSSGQTTTISTTTNHRRNEEKHVTH